jgi:hypothetical protein
MRLENAKLGLRRQAEFLVACATADEPDDRQSLHHTVACIVACLDELLSARAVARMSGGER